MFDNDRFRKLFLAFNGPERFLNQLSKSRLLPYLHCVHTIVEQHLIIPIKTELRNPSEYGQVKYFICLCKSNR